jgi:MFS family permease
MPSTATLTALLVDPTGRNTVLLALGTALAFSGNSMVMSMAALAGNMLLGEDKMYATLPLALQMASMLAFTIPASLFMQRYGRKLGFSMGSLAGMVGGLVGALGIWMGSFELFLVAGVFWGLFMAVSHYYRFAAADMANSAFRPTAISLVMSGGVIAAFIGPNVAQITRDALPPFVFAGSYLALTLLTFLSLVLMRLILIAPPKQTGAVDTAGARPLRVIMRDLRFSVAVTSSAVGYSMMTYVMSATPLAMLACGFDFGATATVIQWHVVAMFLPSFFTGSLIRRYGEVRLIAAGALLIIGSVLVNLSGVAFGNFQWALILLGVGWNFMFIAGSALVTHVYTLPERAKVQAAHDFITYTTVAICAFGAGWMQSDLGWVALNVSVLGPLAVVGLALLAWVCVGRRSVATVA